MCIRITQLTSYFHELWADLRARINTYLVSCIWDVLKNYSSSNFRQRWNTKLCQPALWTIDWKRIRSMARFIRPKMNSHWSVNPFQVTKLFKLLHAHIIGFKGPDGFIFLEVLPLGNCLCCRNYLVTMTYLLFAGSQKPYPKHSRLSKIVHKLNKKMVHNINYEAVKTGGKRILPCQPLPPCPCHPVHCDFPFKGKIDDNAAFHRLASAACLCVCVCAQQKIKNFIKTIINWFCCRQKMRERRNTKEGLQVKEHWTPIEGYTLNRIMRGILWGNPCWVLRDGILFGGYFKKCVQSTI